MLSLSSGCSPSTEYTKYLHRLATASEHPAYIMLEYVGTAECVACSTWMAVCKWPQTAQIWHVGTMLEYVVTAECVACSTWMAVCKWPQTAQIWHVGTCGCCRHPDGFLLEHCAYMPDLRCLRPLAESHADAAGNALCCQRAGTEGDCIGRTQAICKEPCSRAKPGTCQSWLCQQLALARHRLLQCPSSAQTLTSILAGNLHGAVLKGQARDMPVNIVSAAKASQPQAATAAIFNSDFVCAGNLQGAVLRGQARDVPVTVVSAAKASQPQAAAPADPSVSGAVELSSEQAAAQGFAVDTASGLIHVPVNASPEHTYLWLEVSHSAVLLGLKPWVPAAEGRSSCLQLPGLQAGGNSALHFPVQSCICT